MHLFINIVIQIKLELPGIRREMRQKPTVGILKPKNLTHDTTASMVSNLYLHKDQFKMLKILFSLHAWWWWWWW
jgi:hypothetical protein